MNGKIKGIELISLAQAAKEFPVAQSTMSQAAREGRLKAQKLGGAWLTTRADIEEAIKSGGLRPRS